jgi:hypothetical protein
MDVEAWCKKIESKLVTAKQFFKNRVGLFDAMPSFNDWQKQACGCGDDRLLLSECKTKWRDKIFSMDYQECLQVSEVCHTE